MNKQKDTKKGNILKGTMISLKFCELLSGSKNIK